MPYIPKVRREQIDSGAKPVSPGELNYKISKVVADYLEFNLVSYATINDILGALEGAKAEFYRRIAAPYEQQKIVENGDVYSNRPTPPTLPMPIDSFGRVKDMGRDPSHSDTCGCWGCWNAFKRK